MASAVALMQAMAGHAPAIRISAPIMICLSLGGSAFSASSTAAEIDQTPLGEMKDLHHSLVVAEKDIGLAMRRKDFRRAKPALDLLASLYEDAYKRQAAANPCLDAMKSLTGVAVAVAYWVHPRVTGDHFSMNLHELQSALGPPDSTQKKWFDEYSATYRTQMPACEHEIGVPTTSRSLPNRLPRK